MDGNKQELISFIESLRKKFPTLGRRKIAEKVIEEKPGHFFYMRDGKKIRYTQNGVEKAMRATFKKPNPIRERPKLNIVSSTKLTPYLKGDPNNVLVIPDLHEPFSRDGIIEHCREVQERYKCGTVVNIGDEVDLCALSVWEKDPDGLSAGSEYIEALKQMKNWYRVFPACKIAIGNHSERMFRLARTAGIPKGMIKSYQEIWEAPSGWEWATSWEINDVLYTHGTGSSGLKAAITRAMQVRQCVVIGHVHTEANIIYSASSKDLIWAMMVGGAIDDKSYAAAYAKENVKKSIVGCGVVLGKLPIYIPMQL